MFRPSRRAVVFAASFALAFASVAPSAHADRSNPDPDTDEESGGLLDLLDLIDITDLLGEPLDVGEMGVPGLDGLPTIEGIGLPALDGLGLPALDGLPAIEGIGLPTLDGLGLGELLPSDGDVGEFGLPLPGGDPLGILDVLSVPGLDINILAEVGLTGAVSLL